MGKNKIAGPLWGPDGNPENYNRSAAGRRVCQLSAETTKFVIDHHRGHNSKEALYILIEPEGDLRMGGPYKTVNKWPKAVEIALAEGIYIYNVRTKKCSRPVWACEPEDRLMRNMTFEVVRLVADPKVYDKSLPRVDAVLFAWENE